MLIIGLGHTARVGKDTCGHILAQHHGFQSLAFADPLREFVYRTHPDVRAIVDRMGWDEGKEAHPIVRKTLVEVGNEARRILGDDVWIRPTFNAISSERAVLTDVRYPNEAEAVKAHGGLVVKVTRPGFDPLPNIADQALVDYEGWDAVIANDGTIDDLQVQLDELLARGTGS